MILPRAAAAAIADDELLEEASQSEGATPNNFHTSEPCCLAHRVLKEIESEKNRASLLREKKKEKKKRKKKFLITFLDSSGCRPVRRDSFS